MKYQVTIQAWIYETVEVDGDVPLNLIHTTAMAMARERTENIPNIDILDEDNDDIEEAGEGPLDVQS